MDAEVNQPLGHVVDGNPGTLFEPAKINDELVRDAAPTPRVDQRIMIGQSCRHVVGVEDSDLRRALEPGRAHQRDVDPRDRQDARTAPRCGRNRADRVLVAWSGQRVAREERGQVSADADRAHAGTAAAVRDAERFMQVQVTDVRADVAGSAQPDLSVHVGAVHVDLTAVLVHDLADLVGSASSNTPCVDG